MSADGWTKTLGGLLLPTMGFANPLGRFQPCTGGGDCCYDPEVCEDCSGSPASLWVDIPALTPGVGDHCDCSDIAGTYQLTKSPFESCTWELLNQPTDCDDGGIFLNGLFHLNVWILYDSIAYFPGVCSLFIALYIGSSAWQTWWAQELSEFLDPIDIPNVPFHSEFTDCYGVGTTAAVYE